MSSLWSMSVLEGRDREVLPLLLALHATEAPAILDATWGKGTMWAGSEVRPVSLDIDPATGADHIGDFTAMPFVAESFDVVVFDPPHLPNDGATSKSLSGSAAPYRAAYGLTGANPLLEGDGITGTFAPFLAEAIRVLKPNGVVFAKIADLVHNHHYQWHHVDFINAARASGMTPCDLLIKRDPAGGNLKSGKWQTPKHLRNAHCYWIVVRKGRRCERKAA